MTGENSENADENTCQRQTTVFRLLEMRNLMVSTSYILYLFFLVSSKNLLNSFKFEFG